MRKFKIHIFGAIGITFVILFLYKDLHNRATKTTGDYKEANDPNKKKHILIWTNPKKDPIMNLGNSQETFVKRNCPVNNCYVTSDRYFLKNINEFDVIIFHGKEIVGRPPTMPMTRSSHQKYVFATMESSANYPVCDARFENYFNWTWTYKLNSDINYGYLTIRDKLGHIIGPKETMHWMKVENMNPISEEVKDKLKNKSRIATWFSSNCFTSNRREIFVYSVQKQLEKYNMEIDIFGRCGMKKCPRDMMESCLQMIEREYYFFFSFENSFAEDYVTEKLLHALNSYTIPVVYGGANYTRFMPDGTYLDARKLGTVKLVKQMISLMNDKEKYYDFFRWHNHYTYHTVFESPESDPYCNLCFKVNDKELYNKTSRYYNFKKWWTPALTC